MRIKLIACEVMYREACEAMARSVNRVDMEVLPQGLHTRGKEKMLVELQAAVDRVPGGTYDAIALGFALCGYGLVGLTARNTRVVVPRAHDCLTLFFGSKERYKEFFDTHPGCYFKSSGWIERIGENTDQGFSEESGLKYNREELVKKYGEEDAEYIIEQMTAHKKQYKQYAYIAMGVEPDDRFERATREEAAKEGLAFVKVQGDMGLIRKLVDGPWDGERFLVLEPGQKVVQRFDELIIDGK